MSDGENEMDVLQRKLVTKTREIEALVTAPVGLSATKYVAEVATGGSRR
jgi:hypothetical protein